ncbi:MAG: hypothetical protein EAZ20_16385, partial [Bacteroidetes bacterium]
IKNNTMSKPISLQQGIKMTSFYRIQKEQILAQAFQGKKILATCETFSRKSIEDLLAKSGCEKLRIYYGMDDGFKVHAILVAVNDADQDILPPADSVISLEADPYLWNDSRRCPDDCPPSSSLNS